VAVERLLTNEAATVAAGRAVGALLPEGSVLLLAGELGAGKTTLIRGIAAVLDVSQPVLSPTFAIIHEYSGRLPLFHFDLYRIAAPEQLYEIGYLDYLARPGIVVIEWPDRLGELASTATHRLELEHHPDGRLLRTADFPAAVLEQL